MLIARLLVLLGWVMLLLVMSAEAVQLIAKMVLLGVVGTAVISGSLMAMDIAQGIISNFTSIYTRAA